MARFLRSYIKDTNIVFVHCNWQNKLRPNRRQTNPKAKTHTKERRLTQLHKEITRIMSKNNILYGTHKKTYPKKTDIINNNSQEHKH